MVLRIFLILLALNTLAFVAHADASEMGAEDRTTAEIEWMMAAAVYDNGGAEEEGIADLADLGARFLKWRLSRDHSDRERFASNRIFSDHGIHVVEDGAAVNLTWRF